MIRQPDGRVFHGPRGGLLTVDTVRNILIRDVLKPLSSKFPTPPDEIGFVDGRVHSFRHFFVSQAFLGGASEGEICEWIGHADSRIIERYRHLADEDAQRKMSQIRFFNSDALPTTELSPSAGIEGSNESAQELFNLRFTRTVAPGVPAIEWFHHTRGACNDNGNGIENQS